MNSLSELVLDSTRIPISGIAFIFMTFVDGDTQVASENSAPRQANGEISESNILACYHPDRDQHRMMNSKFQDMMDRTLLNNQIQDEKKPSDTDLDDDSFTNTNGAKRALELLSLRDNKLDHTTLKKLKQKVGRGTLIKKLDLSDNEIGDKGCKYLSEYFSENTTIEQLILNNNGLSEAGVTRLADMFRVCKTLKIISVAGNEKIKEIAPVAEKRARLSED